MSRVRASALALVNWKGVFFERYLLDRHVTALEGANGAGKTTVMIAAYLVLLPDLSRLRFTNLGETGATGGDKGIWGRLGESGRPSYAVLDLDLANGQRLLAGVELERKAEPSLELTPFLVSDLDASVSLSDVLLVNEHDLEQVPNLEELQANVTRQRGRLQRFQSTKDYFAALFERGVTPLRLASDEERNKLNEMLRTSMTGGISRALTSDLRGFLLREETGLSDTLTRMRGNLDACRRTRGEVGESRRLEQEISSVFEAGSSMYDAAALATRLTAEELRKRLDTAVRAHAELELSVRAFDAALSETAAHEARLSERRAAAQSALAAELERGRKLQRGAELARRLAELAAELHEAANRAAGAAAEREHASEKRLALKSERERARAAYERAGQGLADSQAGLEELHRNAHAVRRAREHLEQARALLAAPELTLAGSEDALSRVRERLAALDADRARADRALELASVRRRDFELALNALRELCGEVVVGSEYERARVELMRLASLEQAASMVPQLEAERERVSGASERQRATRQRALELGLSTQDGANELRTRRSEIELRTRELEQTAASERALAEQARTAARIASERAENLGRAQTSFAAARKLAERLHPSATRELASRSDVSQLQTKLVAEREQLRAEFAQRIEQRERLAAQKAALESGSGAIDAELLRLRDEVDGELLVNRFEELEVEEAARLEAELGPLAEAIFVEDAERAARSIAGQRRSRATVIFVDERSDLSALREGQREGDDLVLREGASVRVTRVPEQPTLGRRARLNRAAELAGELTELDLALERLQEELRHNESAVRDAEALSALAAALEAGDPAPERQQQEAAARAQQTLCLEHEDLATRAVEAMHVARAELGRVTDLLSEAHLLDPPDHAERLAQMSLELERARTARAELERSASARRQLQEWLEVLRSPPPNELELSRLQHERSERDAERERIFRGKEALEALLQNQHATSFEDAELALERQTALLAGLRAQHEAARATLDQTENALVTVEAEWERAAQQFSELDAARAAVQAHHTRTHQELAELELGETPDSPADSAERAAGIGLELSALEREERSLSAETAVRKERRDRRVQELADLAEGRDALRELTTPAEQALFDFRESASSAGLADSLTLPAPASPSAALWPEASSKLELLLGRLASARGGEELVTQIRAEEASDAHDGSRYLRVWLQVREWLRRRVPTQLTESEEPLEALERLRDQLALLEQRLNRQELDLRGASEDVARGIEVQLRRAKAQVRRLNQTLDGIAFGSIHGIRVKMQRVERMDQILTALREGAAQELLFQSQLPIEEALGEIFKRFGGGKTGGQKLLDYREYLELGVEVKRRAEADWEPANPTRVSTGEAIGVGATLMMVILTEWERDANLLRSKRSAGTLRFLFLDEANRLSQDNLGVLFELCRTLDLQLLIAAPEVARAEGNTTYRLVRRLGDDGKEQVIVTGRRAQPTGVEAVPDAAPPTPQTNDEKETAEQLSLLG